MAGRAYLHKMDAITKMIHHRLIAACFPPFYRKVPFSAGGNEPKIAGTDFFFERQGVPLTLGQVDVSFEFRRSNPFPNRGAEMFRETLQEVDWSAVALIYQRILALDHPD